MYTRGGLQIQLEMAASVKIVSKICMKAVELKCCRMNLICRNCGLGDLRAGLGRKIGRFVKLLLMKTWTPAKSRNFGEYSTLCYLNQLINVEGIFQFCIHLRFSWKISNSCKIRNFAHFEVKNDPRNVEFAFFSANVWMSFFSIVDPRILAVQHAHIFADLGGGV